MKVFISWSGDRSRAVAKALRDWLHSMFHYVEPWVSSEDIKKGARWSNEIAETLEESDFGIICLDRDNLREPWINFEAGAMAHSIKAKHVSPLLVGLGPPEVEGPLKQFQFTVFEKEDMRRLARNINSSSANQIEPARLDKTFDSLWRGLNEQVEPLYRNEEKSPAPAQVSKEPEELPDQQVQILKLLAENPHGHPYPGQIASSIGENPTRTQYHLDELKQKRLNRKG